VYPHGPFVVATSHLTMTKPSRLVALSPLPPMDPIQALADTCLVTTAHDAVLNSECAYTFHSPFTTTGGIVVNLNTFIGTVAELAGNGIFVRIVKKRVPKELDEASATKEQPTKLGVGVEGGFASEDNNFEIVSTYSIVVLEKDGSVVSELPYDETTKASFPDSVVKSADSVIHHSGMAVQQDLKVWELDEEPKPVSKYYESLPFIDNGVAISPNPSDWKCEKSGDTENLWLNLSDGFIGGGRKNWDGSGGSNGALDHFLETGEKYPLVVKLGTITADISTADCYSYAKDEDGPVQVPNLAQLLEKRGIHVNAMYVNHGLYSVKIT
jgi:ubiquitin carboxyl-terminal hydrolase 5/13